MALQSITLDLPDSLVRRANQAASTLNRPLEEVLTATLAASLPDLGDVPLEMQAELARMTWASDRELWAISRETLAETDEKELMGLVEAQAEGGPAPADSQRLEQLRHQYGRLTLRKARAFALLSLRGGTPLLADLNS